MQRITYKSRVVNFFVVGNHYIIEEPDGGMSAMALVCALILTIPFGIFSFLNNDFFKSIREAIEVYMYIYVYSLPSFLFIDNHPIYLCIYIYVCMYVYMHVYKYIHKYKYEYILEAIEVSKVRLGCIYIL
jgi:hypothetical protein